MRPIDTFRDLRVLIAEDNWLIGESLREILTGLGCVVIGPIPNLDELMAAIDANGFDAALLDVHLGSANVLPAATRLAALGIPFIVMTGSGSSTSLPAVLFRAPRLNKPFDARLLTTAMNAAFLNRTANTPAAC